MVVVLVLVPVVEKAAAVVVKPAASARQNILDILSSDVTGLHI